MAFSPKGVIWVLSVFERIRLSRYCDAIRERNSCLYRICRKNIFCSKYMISIFIFNWQLQICNVLLINMFKAFSDREYVHCNTFKFNARATSKNSDTICLLDLLLYNIFKNLTWPTCHDYHEIHKTSFTMERKESFPKPKQKKCCLAYF